MAGSAGSAPSGIVPSSGAVPPATDPCQSASKSSSVDSMSNRIIEFVKQLSATESSNALSPTASTTNTGPAGGPNASKNPTKPPAKKKIVMPGDPKRYPVKFNKDEVKIVDFNYHAVKKGVSSALLDVSLLMANASQLKAVVTSGPETTLYSALVALLLSSLVLQIAVGCALIWLGRININDAEDHEQSLANRLNDAIMVAVFLLTLINVFIASIGINTTPPQLSQLPNNNTTQRP